MRTVALLLYSACGIAAALSLILNALQNQFAGIIVVLFCVSAWIGIQHLGYVEFATARQLVSKGTFRRIIDAHSRLQQFEKILLQADSLEHFWDGLLSGSRDFGFQSLRLTVDGEVFDAILSPAEDGTVWEINVPIQDSRAVRLTRHVAEERLDLVAVGAFTQSVAAHAAQKLTELVDILPGRDRGRRWVSEGGAERATATSIG